MLWVGAGLGSGHGGAIGITAPSPRRLSLMATPSTPSTLPRVEEVRPGLWSIPVPLPMNSLRYVLVYAFESAQGPYLIDAGWNTDEAFDALGDGLKRAGFGIS